MMVAMSQVSVALYIQIYIYIYIFIYILYKVSLNSNNLTYNGNYITFIEIFFIFYLNSLYSRIQ